MYLTRLIIIWVKTLMIKYSVIIGDKRAPDVIDNTKDIIRFIPSKASKRFNLSLSFSFDEK